MGQSTAFVLMILYGFFSIAHTQNVTHPATTSSLSVEAKKVEVTIQVDGRLDEKAWQNTSAVNAFFQREPRQGNPVSERTEVRLLYDINNLYIGFRCCDSEPQKIVANEMRRDMQLLDNDCVEIFLDTYHDHRTAFYFSTNPLGAQRDGTIIGEVDDDEQNWDWNGVWDNASHIDSAGWTAEIAIPFKTLRYHKADELIWGVNFARYIPRKREEAFWSPILRDFGSYGKYRASAYGHLTGLQHLQQPTKLEFKPYGLSGLQRDFTDNLSYERKFDIGVDAKYHVTPNLTTDISWNTDFAQVEADQEQVNLTRFELFFPEKRDFFLEGAGIFRFGERTFSLPASVLFFSRRMGLSEDNEPIPILGGVKMTGKTGSFNIGLLNMIAKQTSYTNDNDDHVTIPRTNFSVLRVQKDILNNSSMGFIGLNKESLDDGGYNRNVGIDANIFLCSKAQVSGFLAKTFSPGKTGDDWAAYGDFFFIDDFWTLLVAQNTIQDNFNAEMGFLPRPGTRKTQVNFGVSPRPGIFGIRQLTTFNDFYFYHKQRGELESRFNATGLWVVFENGATFLARLDHKFERLTETFEIHESINIYPGKYTFNNFFGEFTSDKSKAFSGSMNITIGDFYDGAIWGYGLGANLKLASRLTANLELSYNDINLSTGDFSTTLLGTRVLYTFSSRLFAKAFVQWNSIEDTILSNFLLNFIHTPGSDLFLVYNEELNIDGKTLKTKNRTLMLKFTYLFNI